VGVCAGRREAGGSAEHRTGWLDNREPMLLRVTPPRLAPLTGAVSSRFSNPMPGVDIYLRFAGKPDNQPIRPKSLHPYVCPLCPIRTLVLFS
jgi:hypothetical protein